MISGGLMTQPIQAAMKVVDTQGFVSMIDDDFPIWYCTPIVVVGSSSQCIVVVLCTICHCLFSRNIYCTLGKLAFLELHASWITIWPIHTYTYLWSILELWCAMCACCPVRRIQRSSKEMPHIKKGKIIIYYKWRWWFPPWSDRVSPI